MSETVHELPKTAVPHREASRRTRDADPAEQLEVSVYLKPRAARPGAAAAWAGRRQTREQLRSRRVVEHAADISAVEAFAARHGLRVVSAEPERRRVRLAGSAAQFGAAFRIHLGVYDAGEGEFRSYSGALSVPGSLGDRIESVLGLDNRRVARPFIVPQAATDAPGGYRPNEAAALYNFPAQATGAGQCVALLEFGGGYYDSDITAAFEAMGLPAPEVTAVGVDGGQNNPGTFTLEDNEVAMDIQIAGGLASDATIAVYFAPFTVQGWVDAITTAAHDETNQPSVISVSWGEREASWGLAEMDSVTSALNDAATLGVTVFAACGDSWATNGSPGRTASVNFPASSPAAIGCGGTSITTSGSSITSEVAWNDEAGGTGGGISDYLGIPAFQAGTTLPPSRNDGGHRRGVPDDAQNTVREQVYEDGRWGPGAVIAAGAAARSSIAAVQWFDASGIHLRVYYQDTRNTVREQCFDGGWQPGHQFTAPAAAPGTGLAAACWTDAGTNVSHLRVYYRDDQNTVCEQSAGTGQWQAAYLSAAAPGSGLAAASWRDPSGGHVRVYYQDPQNVIREHCYDSGTWASGQFVGPAR